MFDDIDPRSSTPLYAQIAARLRLAIAAGEVHAGQGLSSVRELAAQLRINPATVAQAYRELEVEGFVEMRQGAGTYVREVPPERRNRARRAEARRLISAMLADAARHGLTTADLRSELDREFTRRRG